MPIVLKCVFGRTLSRGMAVQIQVLPRFESRFQLMRWNAQRFNDPQANNSISIVDLAVYFLLILFLNGAPKVWN